MTIVLELEDDAGRGIRTDDPPIKTDAAALAIIVDHLFSLDTDSAGVPEEIKVRVRTLISGLAQIALVARDGIPSGPIPEDELN